MAQTPYHIRFVKREVGVNPDGPGLMRSEIVLIPQQFLPVTKFSEAKGRVVEFWTWKDIPLFDPENNSVLADAVQIPLSR